MSRLAFVFPGQGSQFIGMGQDIARSCSQAREVLEMADQAVGFPLSELMANGPSEELRQTVNTQPAVVTHSLAVLAAVRARGLEPYVVAGHSVGEYAAVAACGALDVEDVLRLVHRRGKYMQEASAMQASGMAALIGADLKSAEALCAAVSGTAPVQVANLNSPGQVVISGAESALNEAVRRAADFRIRKAIRLEVSGAFHSCLMEPAARWLAEDLRQAPLREPRIPLVANRTALPVSEVEELRQVMSEQVVSRVLWEASIRHMLDMGVTHFLELGPGAALAGMIKRITTEALVMSIQDTPSLDKAMQNF
ncbi:MAG: ACP S-malonyltransferase [Candidatus Xenobium sp.]|jgi:[acyl-carrier-protein] S-malonyltransferase|nr:ACP S-malonyltransferase [Burkholderiales bacterium]